MDAIQSFNMVNTMVKQSIAQSVPVLPVLFVPVSQPYSFNIDPMTFYARPSRIKISSFEDSLLGFTPKELSAMSKKDDTDLDDNLYYMKKKLGRLPRAGEYVIRVSSRKDDVRIVRTLEEKKRWGSEIMDGGIPILRPYTVVCDPDGIHAKVVINEASLLVARCANCGNLFVMNDIPNDPKKLQYCCKECRQAGKAKIKANTGFKEQRRSQQSEETQMKIKNLEDFMGVKFKNAY